jgi:hypothetical protein
MDQSRFPPPKVWVLCLDGFIARPGYSARPGELVEVLPSVANTLIATGKARLPTREDPAAAEDLEHRDPQPTHRDPLPPRPRDPLHTPIKRKRP